MDTREDIRGFNRKGYYLETSDGYEITGGKKSRKSLFYK
jgi:hypothetical protein